jgi:hypothetical protein
VSARAVSSCRLVWIYKYLTPSAAGVDDAGEKLDNVR